MFGDCCPVWGDRCMLLCALRSLLRDEVCCLCLCVVVVVVRGLLVVAVCWVYFVVWCLLFAVWCSLFRVWCVLLLAACRLLFDL